MRRNLHVGTSEEAKLLISRHLSLHSKENNFEAFINPLVFKRQSVPARRQINWKSPAPRQAILG